jgi:low temperature requirement protein LtrA
MLRTRSEHTSSRVTTVELFFDLVFVFAVTQLSHRLLAHLDGLGAIQTALLLVAVWWVWIYTSWVTNWLDPDSTPVRFMLFGLMLAGLVLSASIPEAFESRALAFAGAYVVMQVGRSLFMLWALRGHSETNFRNFQRITRRGCRSPARSGSPARSPMATRDWPSGPSPCRPSSSLHRWVSGCQVSAAP